MKVENRQKNGICSLRSEYSVTLGWGSNWRGHSGGFGVVVMFCSLSCVLVTQVCSLCELSLHFLICDLLMSYTYGTFLYASHSSINVYIKIFLHVKPKLCFMIPWRGSHICLFPQLEDHSGHSRMKTKWGQIPGEFLDCICVCG